MMRHKFLYFDVIPAEAGIQKNEGMDAASSAA